MWLHCIRYIFTCGCTIVNRTFGLRMSKKKVKRLNENFFASSFQKNVNNFLNFLLIFVREFDY